MKKLQRREFLEGALAGAAGICLANGMASEAAAAADPAALVPLGKHLKVCRLGFGTGMAGGNRQSNQTRLGREKFENLLRYAYDRNVRLFDMADLYGTHAYVGRVMKEKPRDSYWLSSKLWFRPKGLPEPERPDADVSIKRFLKELQADYLDLVQIHCMTSAKWPQEMRKQMDIMADLKRKGLIRAHGVSVHTIEALTAAAEEPWVDVIHVRLNPFKHRTDGPMEQVIPIIKKAAAAGKGLIAMKLIGEGQFNAQQREESFRFVMGLGCVDVLVVGIEKPQHVDEMKSRVERILAAT